MKNWQSLLEMFLGKWSELSEKSRPMNFWQLSIFKYKKNKAKIVVVVLMVVVEWAAKVVVVEWVTVVVQGGMAAMKGGAPVAGQGGAVWNKDV